MPAAVPEQQAAAAPVYVAPREHRLRGKLLGAGGFIAMVIAAFVIGTLVHGSNPKPKEGEVAVETTATTSTAPTKPARRADITLVPVADGSAIPTEAPITSAPAAVPAQGIPSDYQRSDATALPSDEYAQAAARARAEQRQSGPSADPMKITGSAYGGAPAAPRRPTPARTPATPLRQDTYAVPMTSAAPPPAAVVVRRTNPIPEYQPIPSIRVARSTTARLNLSIGADGRVTDVEISQPIPGETPKLIAAVQNWRFRPATENGVPVASRFSVDISFHGSE